MFAMLMLAAMAACSIALGISTSALLYWLVQRRLMWWLCPLFVLFWVAIGLGMLLWIDYFIGPQ
jgi:hypothetical protein